MVVPVLLLTYGTPAPVPVFVPHVGGVTMAAAAARLLRLLLLLGVRRHTSGVAQRCASWGCGGGSSSCASLSTLLNVSSSESTRAPLAACRAAIDVDVAVAVAEADADTEADAPPSDAEAGVASAGRSVFGEMEGMLGPWSTMDGYCALKSTGKLGGPEHNWLDSDRGRGDGWTFDDVGANVATTTRRICGCDASS